MFFCLSEKGKQILQASYNRFSAFDNMKALIHIVPITTLPEMGALITERRMGLFIVQQYSNGYCLRCMDNNEQYLYCNSTFDTVYLPFNYSSVDNTLELLLNVFRSNLVLNGAICAHGAVAVCDGDAVMFCGPSTAGKSTQAKLWRDKLGAWILNYDKPVLLKKNGYQISGSPWSGKEPCYINRQIPLRAVFFVEKHSENYLKRLTPAEAFGYMYPNYMPMPVNDCITEVYETLVADWAQAIPIYILYCTMEEDAVRIAYNAVYDSDYDRMKQHNGGGVSMRRNESFAMRRIADDYVIIARGANAVNFNATLITNELGAYIWKLLEHDTSVGELVTEVLEEYEIDEATARADIDEFLNQLKEENLLLY